MKQTRTTQKIEVVYRSVFSDTFLISSLRKICLASPAFFFLLTTTAAKNAWDSSRQLSTENCSEVKQKCQDSISDDCSDNATAIATNGELRTPTWFLLWVTRFFPLHCAILVLQKIKSLPKYLFQLATRSVGRNGYIVMTPVETSWIPSLWDSALVKNDLFYLFARLELKSAI